VVLLDGRRDARRLGRREEVLPGLSTADSEAVTLGRSTEARGVETVETLFFRRGGK
jgi:hypothetical protein